MAEEGRTDERAHRVAEEVGFGDLELVHHLEHVLAHRRVAEGLRRRGCLAASVAARVHQHESTQRRQHVDPSEVDPVALGIRAPSVHEHERSSVADDVVVDSHLRIISHHWTAGRGCALSALERHGCAIFGCAPACPAESQ